MLKGVEDVCDCHGREGTQLLDIHLRSAVRQEIDDGFGPVGAISHQAEIRERFFGRSGFAFAFGEFVAEGDELFAVSQALVLGEGEDAGHVVSLGRFFFFGEVADEMAAVRVTGGHAVEEKGVDVVIECFVIEEEFGEEAEVTTPDPLATAVNLKKRDVIIAVDLVTRWV